MTKNWRPISMSSNAIELVGMTTEAAKLAAEDYGMLLTVDQATGLVIIEQQFGLWSIWVDLAENAQACIGDTIDVEMPKDGNLSMLIEACHLADRWHDAEVAAPSNHIGRVVHIAADDHTIGAVRIHGDRRRYSFCRIDNRYPVCVMGEAFKTVNRLVDCVIRNNLRAIQTQSREWELSAIEAAI